MHRHDVVSQDPPGGGAAPTAVPGCEMRPKPMEEWTNHRVPEAEPGGTYCAHNHAPGLVTAPTVHNATTLSFIVKCRRFGFTA